MLSAVDMSADFISGLAKRLMGLSQFMITKRETPDLWSFWQVACPFNVFLMSFRMPYLLLGRGARFPAGGGEGGRSPF